MSDHADTIRRAIYANGPQEWEVPIAALDALLVEKQQLREALEALERSATAHELAMTDEERNRTEALLIEALKFAREALAGDTE